MRKRFFFSANKKIVTKYERERATKGLLYATSVFFFAFGASWVVVPLYQLICGAQGGQAKREGFASHKQTAPTLAEMEKGKDRLIRVEFASSVQGKLRWKFEPEQKYIYVRPGETALAFFKAKNKAVVPVIGTSVYHMIPPEAGLYLNKIQCFCFDEQLLAPGEEIEMPVFFYIDPEIVNDRRFDHIDNMTLTYIFMEAPGAEIPADYKDLEKRLGTNVQSLVTPSNNQGIPQPSII
jgi:cytochrome c oxidase assembly protein subunit 11